MEKPEVRLTPELLTQLGFTAVAETSHRFSSGTVYRLKLPKTEQGYYSYDIQVSIGDYPDSNPNSGIVCLYSKREKVPSYDTRKDGKLVKRLIDFPEQIIPIAWHVTTFERLRMICFAIASYDLLS